MTERRRPHDPDVTARCRRVRAVMEAHGCSVETALAYLIERGEVPEHVRPNKVRQAMKLRGIDPYQPLRPPGQPELLRAGHRRSEALAATINAQCERSKAVGRRIEQKPEPVTKAELDAMVGDYLARGGKIREVDRQAEPPAPDGRWWDLRNTMRQQPGLPVAPIGIGGWRR